MKSINFSVTGSDECFIQVNEKDTDGNVLESDISDDKIQLEYDKAEILAKTLSYVCEVELEDAVYYTRIFKNGKVIKEEDRR